MRRQTACIDSSVAMMPSSAQPLVLGFQAGDVECALHDELEHLGVDGFRIEVPGAEADGAHRALAVGIAGNNDDLGLRRKRKQLLERRHALAHALGVRRQAEVLQHHGRFEAAHVRHRLAARGRLDHFVAVEAPLELLLQPEVVLDDQEALLVFGHVSSLIQNWVPTPGVLCTSTSPPSERTYSRTW
jgi:hypothetical protein